ncbi:hypothetical protein DFH08DRAFT_720405, partial [Mycena albidolilacea]
MSAHSDAENATSASARLLNFRDAYLRLQRKVDFALRTQLGDAERLTRTSHEAARFLSALEEHQFVFPAAEFATLRDNIAAMQEALDKGATQSADPVNIPPVVVMRKVPNGKGTGRPRLDIDTQFLSSALPLRGPTGIARSIGCSPRTVRRAALKSGLVEPGNPVHRHEIQTDGSVARVWQSTAPAIPAISDDPEALDWQVADILSLFPHFGREMIFGALAARGFRVPVDQIEASYRRIVIHCFIDGKTRFIVGIRASTNNRSTTVLHLFEDATALHGWPSRAEVGDRTSGERDSVHNIRIERLWVDWTNGVGRKWVNFFYELEVSGGL